MQLIYAADGRDQPAWTVDAVDREPGLKENADCARVRTGWRTEQAFELREIRSR
jgi:hypothetical protein